MDQHQDTSPRSGIGSGVQKKLWIIAAIILVAGVAAAWWFQRSQTPAAQHPETVLFQQRPEQRLLLAETFRSYDSETATVTLLEAAGLTVQRQLVQRPPSERYPPRRAMTLTVAAYKHLDCEGTLVLEFFNDRLMEADFRPDDPARYAPRLHRRYPALVRDRTAHAEFVDAPLRVWSSVDLAKSKVGRTLGSEGMVLWQDLRLIAQRDDWDARFGHIPVPFNPD